MAQAISENLPTPVWTEERATRWWQTQPFWVGCNFIPSTAINPLEMWQDASFDRPTIERELGYAAGLGFNICRVYLHDLLWQDDGTEILARIDEFLALAHREGIGVMLVPFDDVWCPDSKLGPQPAPTPGRHNSGWVQSPGLAALKAYPTDPALRDRLERYVRGVISAFAFDARVWIWDLYNEPGGFPSPRDEPVGELCLPLLRDVFAWARDEAPSQPITCGLWTNIVKPSPPEIAALQLAHSDIVSFHHYGPVQELQAECERIRSLTRRPLICTEYLARQLSSRFETHLPYFQEEQIGAINWGLVNGKTQTIYPWWSWFDQEAKPEPEVWFHDILRSDGSAFDEAEVGFLRKLLLAK